ncbi:MAG: H-NS family nucleoid-associated regulatory protein, partial [Spirochaetota bacterium]
KSMEELLAQKAKIEDEIASLERQRAIEALGKSTEVRSIAKQIAKLGLSDEELVTLFRNSQKPKSTRKPRSSAKNTKKKTPTIPVATYQHPEDPSTTWSGRGRKPGWILEWIESGKAVEELRKE